MSSFARSRLLLVLVLAAVGLAAGGAAAQPAGSWDFSAGIAAGQTVVAAHTGQLTLSLHNQDGTLLAGVDGSKGAEPLDRLAAGQTLIVWTAPAGQTGQQLVGIARSDVYAVQVVFNDGRTQLLLPNGFHGFSESDQDAQLIAVEALDATGATIGELTVAPTGPTCGQMICRLLTTTNAQAPPTRSAAAVYGLFSTSQPLRVNKRPLVRYAGRTTISQIDPKTLRPLGRRLKLPTLFVPMAFSPDGRYLLGYGQEPTGGDRRFSIIDLRRLSTNANLDRRLGAAIGLQDVRVASWPTADRVLLVAERYSVPYRRRVVSRILLAVNPHTGTVVWRRSLTHTLRILDSATIDGKLVLQLGDSSLRKSKEAVLVASPDGTVRTGTVDFAETHRQLQITALVTTTGTAPPAAYLVAASGTIASIDLDTAKAELHRVAAPANAPTGPFLAPGPAPVASSIGGRIVAGGIFDRPDGTPRGGVYLINPHNWTAHLIDRKANDFATGHNRVITYNPGTVALTTPQRSATGIGTGIAIYNQDGTRLHHLYGQRRITTVGLTPLFAYAFAVKAGRIEYPLLIGTGQRLVFNPITGKTLGHNRAAALNSPRLISPEIPLRR